MKNKEATFLKVKHFVAKNLVEKEERLTLDTTLEDLGVDGIDGYDFFVDFSKEFAVDISELDLSLHFGPEGCSFSAFPKCISKIIAGDIPMEPEYIPITIADLVEAVEAKKWIKKCK